MITLRESTDMTIDEFGAAVKNIYAKYFPNSMCTVRYMKNLGGALWIDFYLAGDPSEFINNIAQNDMFRCCLGIYLNGEGKEDAFGTQTLTASNSSIAVAPDNKYLAFGTVKIPFRKTAGDAKKLLQVIDKYCKRLYDTVIVQRNEGNIHPKYADLLDQKI